ncbi:hypothetical protein [Micromonospora sp. IBHARD004]|uniref:hypothetical protein n=1 Tax=Micromonospora sp. IBHARD004 TaxID=3457764 RepID=UPI0040581E79
MITTVGSRHKISDRPAQRAQRRVDGEGTSEPSTAREPASGFSEEPQVTGERLVTFPYQ